ncbi:hypothetical protein J45TS6_15890 [Paenibacillus sp. J45TS6]|uniref:hypothetical protein n=1 Tax=Paenibacillus sp. J45TS6 TaxID=2807196 RepID=UPI001B18FAB8|nr:hypothetical protein [Paenibacillus sp. J45TS6]GIP43130.1 hypothetical protein J45TS6_15890 [Paenibacillus sp. J45TS6]
MNKKQTYTFPVLAILQGAAELIYSYALIVILSVYVLGNSPIYVLCIGFVAISAGVLGGRVLYMKSSTFAVVAAVLGGMLITTAALMAGSAENRLLFIIAGVVLGGAVGYRGFYLQKHIEHSIFISGKYRLFGLISLVVLSFFVGRYSSLMPYSVGVYVSGLVSFILLLWNRHSQEMRKVTLDPKGQRPLVRSFTRINQLRTLIFITIVLFVGAFQRLSEVAASVWSWFTAWVRNLFNRETPQENIPNSSGVTEVLPPFLPNEERIPQEPSPIWEFLLRTFVFLAAIVVLCFILYKAWKLFLKFTEYLEHRKKNPMPGVPPKTAYIDIIETIEEKPKKKSWLRFFQRESVPSDPKERIRYYYREYILRVKGQGLEIPVHLTPFEVKQELDKIKTTAKTERTNKKHKDDLRAAPNDLFPLYNEVRYGKRNVSEEAIQQIDREWKTNQ